MFNSPEAQGVGGSYLNQAGSYALNEGLNAATEGLFGQIIDAGLSVDDATGGLLSTMQDAYLYPAKILTNAMLGNTEVGKSWIDFIESNMTISGIKRKRNQVDNVVKQDDVTEGFTSGDALDPEVLKRLKINMKSDFVVPRKTEVEVDVNKKMKQRTGNIFQAPKGFRKRISATAGRVGQGQSTGQRMKQIASMYQVQSAY